MIRAVVVTIAVAISLGLCLFGGAGELSWPVAWAILGIYSLFKLAAFIFVNPELLRERASPGPGVIPGDVLIAALGYLGLFHGAFYIAGLDAVRYGPAVHIPLAVQLAALLIYTIGNGFAFWAVLCNPFFSTFVRIQTDRDHTVVSSGAYALVRHPGYAGALLAHLALPFALGSIWALVPVVFGTIFFVLRTSREDRTLRDHLPGYQEYQARVRWRLMPGIW